MQQVISLAQEVKSTGDVPVGALVVNEMGEIQAGGFVIVGRPCIDAHNLTSSGGVGTMPVQFGFFAGRPEPVFSK